MFKVKDCAKQETSRNRQQAQLGLIARNQQKQAAGSTWLNFLP
jgi:hypothetical protein